MIAWFQSDRRTASFSLEGSLDDAIWTPVFSEQRSGTTLDFQTVDLADITARFIRIIGLGNSENDFNSITEVEICGHPRNPSESDPADLSPDAAA